LPILCSQNVIGLSPFTPLELRFDWLKASRANYYQEYELEDDIYLVLDLEATQTNALVNWGESSPTCKP
jgi:hypothetical protein